MKKLNGFIIQKAIHAVFIAEVRIRWNQQILGICLKHAPLNQYISFSSAPAGAGQESEATLDELLPGSPVHDPVNQVISSEELRALVGCISTTLSELESQVLALYLDGHSYEEVGRRLGCDCKTVDNALQRVKRKVGQHLAKRAIPG